MAELAGARHSAAGVIFAGASALYYGSNAFLPGYLTSAGRPDLVNPALTALNAGQLPASLLLIGFARHLERKVWPFVLTGLISIGCIGIIVVTANAATVAATAVLGFVIGAAFALGLTLPPLLSAPGEVARVSAAMFTISYASAMAVAVIGGVAWDLTGIGTRGVPADCAVGVAVDPARADDPLRPRSRERRAKPSAITGLQVGELNFLLRKGDPFSP